MKRGRIGRAAAMVVFSAAALGITAGIAIHLLQSGGASGAQDNLPGLQGQATWEPGTRPAPDFSLTDRGGHRVSLASFRGGNVMLAFLGSRCRSACAREARYLGMALRPASPGGSAGDDHRERRSAARHA
jgi:cytochrome oxidase Cu insertion factor (SCO1/SenC/PrrC family)